MAGSSSGAMRAIRGDALIGGRIVEDALITYETRGVGKIRSIGRARRSTLAKRARRVRGLIVPGYIDMHLHGAGGHDVLGAGGAEALLLATRGGKSPEREIVASLRALAASTAQHGYAAIVPATVSLPIPSLRMWMRAVAVARQEQRADALRGRARGEALILGAHIEGPAITPARAGAHDLSTLVTATALLAALRERPEDWSALRIVTHAPELEGADALIDYLVARKIVSSVGHTSATFERATAAWDRGARSTTHLCNGMDPFHHRTPGVVGAALSHSTAHVEMICDGVHVDLRIAKLFAELLGSRLVMVSDACPHAGLGDGEFMLGSMRARVRGARATLADGTLVGAVSLVDVGVANLIGAGVPVAAAVDAATRAPASVLRTRELGHIAPGAAARFAVVDRESGAFVERIAP
jgi:N-acetylglucosamine-6-phosphate deacetylase